MSALEQKMKEVLPELIVLAWYVSTETMYGGQMVNTLADFGDVALSVSADFVPGTDKVRAFSVAVLGDPGGWLTSEWMKRVGVTCGDTSEWTSAEKVVEVARALNKEFGGS